MNEHELKIQALTESLGKLTQRYETEIADLRVQLTLVAQQNEELAEKLADKSTELVQPEVIEGNVL